MQGNGGQAGNGARRGALPASLAAGVLGGAVVVGLGWLSISAGWIDVTEESAPAAQPSLVPARETAGGSAGVGDIYERSAQGVAYIEADSGGRAGIVPGAGRVASGSGFVIDDEGHVLTNEHVVAGAEGIDVILGDDEDPVEAEVVGTDPSTDLALLRVEADADDLHPLPLGRSAEIRVGDPVVAIGNPFGLDGSVTSGIVSALARQIDAPNDFTITDVIQTDAPINPGNSGGPLIDASGRVIGVNSQIATGGSGGNVGIGFAVPIDTAREVVSQILENGEVEHAYLGLTVADLDAELADVLNLDVDRGALVQEVAGGGPAEEAGIRGGRAGLSVAGAELAAGGDVIVSIDGERVDSGDDVVTAVNGREPGEEIELGIVRGDERTTVTVTLADRPTEVDSEPRRQAPRLPGIPGLP